MRVNGRLSEMTGLVIEQFLRIAAAQPDRPAVSDLDRSWSYGALAGRAGAIAAVISRSAGAGPVAVLLPHDARYPAAMLGVLAAGRAVVPLDATSPAERNLAIIGDASATTIVADGQTASGLGGTDGRLIIDIDRLTDPQPVSIAPAAAGPEDLAWIIYTSGSTGRPKGVFQNHAGFRNDVREAIVNLGMRPDDRVPAIQSATTSAGFRVCFSTLLCGANLDVLAPAQLGPARLLEELRRRRPTTLRCVPALLRRLCDELGDDGRLDSVRSVFLSGDRVEWNDYDLARHHMHADVRVGTMIGATEVSTIHSLWIVDERARIPGESLPVGYPLPELDVTLIDEHGQPVADGQTGEIVVAGDHLALGYWRAPEATAAAFSLDPRSGRRRYRTGDLATRRRDGLLIHRGRKDQQVKLSGRRIEPAEIEAAIGRCSGVRDAAVVIRRNHDGGVRSLAAYVEPLSDADGLRPRHVAAMLADKLPAFMVPGAIFIQHDLPRLGNFKVDRIALAALDLARQTSRDLGDNDPLRRRVMEVFEGVLNVRSTPEDSLRSLGGDSLQAVSIIAGLSKAFAVPLADDFLEPDPTIAEIARLIGERVKSAKASG